MPGRFTSPAASVIVSAVERARADGTSRISEDHLFAALLGNPDSAPLLGEAEPVWAEVRDARRRGGITAGEKEALAEFGIDVDEVVARVEARLGAGALDDTPAQPRRGWRTGMSPEARAVLHAAHRQKAARGDRDLTPQHPVLGLLAQPGPLAEALRARGITVATALEAMDRAR